MGNTAKKKANMPKGSEEMCDKTQLTDNEKLLIDALDCALHDREAEWNSAAVNDEKMLYLYALAQRQKLLPLVVNAIYGCEGVKESTLLPDMKRKVVSSVMLQLRRISALEVLYNSLIESGIKPLIFKGAVCRTVYPHGEYRLSCDEDILVSQEDFHRAGEVFEKLGFERYDLKENEDNNFVITWVDRNSSLNVELHRSLFEETSDAVGGMCGFFTSCRENCAKYTSDDGFEFCSLNPHDHMLLLIFHAYKHFIHSGFGLRQICDIGMWAKKYSAEINWDELYKQCASVRAAIFAVAVFKIAVKYLHIELDLPKRWSCEKIDELPMLKDLLSGGVYGATNGTRLHSGTIMFKMVEADRRSEKKSLMRTVFPKLSYMKQKYPTLEKYPVLLPAMWCVRIASTFKDGNSPKESLNITNERKKLMKKYGIID